MIIKKNEKLWIIVYSTFRGTDLFKQEYNTWSL